MIALVLPTAELPAAEDPIRKAADFLATGDVEAALTALQRAIVADGDSVRAHFAMGLVAWRLSQLDQALALLRACHERAPMNGSIAEVLASLYAQAGNLGDSLYFGKLATALPPVHEFAELLPPSFPTFDDAFLSITERPLLARAKVLLAKGSLTESLDLAWQHVALYPEDHEARIFLAECLLRAAETDAAVETLRPLASGGAMPAAAESLYAQALTAVGERDEGERRHALACAAAPDDAAIAAARVADAPWLAEDADEIATRAADWACRFLPPRKAPSWHGGEDKIAVGYLVLRPADQLDAAAIAAVAKAHDRSRVTVHGFGIGEKTWKENAPFIGAFDKWRDIAGIDPATLARILRSEDLHVIVDCCGFAAPTSLQALARLHSAIRVAWLGNPSGLGQPLYDAVLCGATATAVDGTSIWRAVTGFPLMRDRLHRRDHVVSGAVRFGADVQLCQIDRATTGLWSAVLAGAPEARLLLRDHDMGPGGNVERLIARFGRDLAARIDVVQASTADDFHARVDIALAPVRGVSPRMAADALACGVPVVALAPRGPAEPYGAMLRDLGLGDALVAADGDDYVSIALRLARSADERARAADLVQAIGDIGESSARLIAATIEDNASAALLKGPSA